MSALFRWPRAGRACRSGRGRSAAAAGTLRLRVEPGALAPFVLALGREEIAVLRLELVESPLRTLFFSLTQGDGA